MHMAQSLALGPLVRIGPNEIFSSNIEILHRVGAARSGYKKSSWYLASQMDPKHENLVSMRDNDRRAERRRKMFAGVSLFLQYETIVEAEPTLREAVRLLCRPRQLNPVSALRS